jgi:hypothetical protein
MSQTRSSRRCDEPGDLLADALLIRRNGYFLFRLNQDFLFDGATQQGIIAQVPQTRESGGRNSDSKKRLEAGITKWP